MRSIWRLCVEVPVAVEAVVLRGVEVEERRRVAAIALVCGADAVARQDPGDPGEPGAW